MPETLYIVGNGFDLYHGLDTEYESFGNFLNDKNPELHRLLIKYFGFRDLYDTFLKRQKDYKPIEWSDFEKALSEINFDDVLEDYSNYVADVSSDLEDQGAYENVIQSFVDDVTNSLRDHFKQFILAIKYPISISDKILNLDPRSYFLNFNYTDTIERFYSKSARILYIHGKAKSQDDIILGHGINPQNFDPPPKRPPIGLTEEEMEMWTDKETDDYNYSYENGKGALLKYFQKSFKPTREIIQNNQQFFDSLKAVKKIYVLGHSLSSVDLPYFEKVIESVEDKNINWFVTYHRDDDYDIRLNSLLSLKLNTDQITLLKIETIKFVPPVLFK